MLNVKIKSAVSEFWPLGGSGKKLWTHKNTVKSPDKVDMVNKGGLFMHLTILLKSDPDEM